MSALYSILAIVCCWFQEPLDRSQKPDLPQAIEKVHLHTDRPYYFVGDTIWFKAYTVVSGKNLPTTLSAYLYVDLVLDDSVVYSQKFRLDKGMANGDVPLDIRLRPGTYRLIAHTRWMLNFDQDHLFRKSIAIFKPTSAINGQARQKNIKNASQIFFFPEGGNLIEGVPSRVAFKGIGPEGLGMGLKGELRDELDNTVCSFSSAHDGMGRFDIMPAKGASYKALITFSDGRQATVPLPPSQSRGYALAVNNVNPQILAIRASASPGMLQDGPLTLTAVSGGSTVYTGRLMLDSSGNAIGRIQKKQFDPGILKLTLFSPLMEPVAERLVFISPAKGTSDLKVKMDRPTHKKNELVQMEIKFPDSSAGHSLSMAVINETNVPFEEESETTILSSLLLSSELKGFVEKPNYYFVEPTAEKMLHLDDLLLTQGWRRYVPDSASIRYAPERGAQISGRVSTRLGKAVAGAKVTMLPLKIAGLPEQAETNTEGRFSVDLLSYPDSTAFMVQAKDPRVDKDVFLELDRLPVLNIGQFPSAELTVFTTNKSSDKVGEGYLNKKNGTMLLREVEITSKRRTKYVPENSWNLNGPGDADAVISNEQIFRSGGLQNAIVAYKGAAKMPHPQWIIDGVLIDSEDSDAIERSLAYYTTDDIESVEILRPNGSKVAIYGIYGQGGVVLVNTKKPKFGIQQKAPSPGLVYHIPQKVYVAQEFYLPPSSLSDKRFWAHRETVYWNPLILPDKNGNAPQTFRTNEEPGTYKVVIEGIGSNGALIRRVARFTVE